jgi:hypothetical protein
MNYLKSVEDLKEDWLSLFSGYPLPLTTSKRTSIKIRYNPQTSENKEADMTISLGKIGII